MLKKSFLISVWIKNQLYILLVIFNFVCKTTSKIVWKNWAYTFNKQILWYGVKKTFTYINTKLSCGNTIVWKWLPYILDFIASYTTLLYNIFLKALKLNSISRYSSNHLDTVKTKIITSLILKSFSNWRIYRRLKSSHR